MDTWQVYQAVQGQILIAPSGKIVTINHLAVWAYIDHYKILNPVRVFEQVCQLAQEIINEGLS